MAFTFWSVLDDLKARGVEDILIACVDGLTGFPEAIAASFPKTEIQLCVVHQIRHSIKYVVSKEQTWQTKWDASSTYFKYSKEIRRLIYTTNAIEEFHCQVHKIKMSIYF